MSTCTRIAALLAVVGASLALGAPLAAFGAGHKHAAGQTVVVTLKEYSITSPLLKRAAFGKASPLKPGTTTFTFNNKGKFPHDFTVARLSPGGSRISSGTIAPGASKTITVNLKPGAYLAVCAQFNGFHYASGMLAGFSVGKISDKGKWAA